MVGRCSCKGDPGRCLEKTGEGYLKEPRGRAAPLFIHFLDSWLTPSRQRHTLWAFRILTIHCIQTQTSLVGESAARRVDPSQPWLGFPARAAAGSLDRPVLGKMMRPHWQASPTSWLGTALLGGAMRSLVIQMRSSWDRQALSLCDLSIIVLSQTGTSDGLHKGLQSADLEWRNSFLESIGRVSKTA